MDSHIPATLYKIIAPNKKSLGDSERLQHNNRNLLLLSNADGTSFDTGRYFINWTAGGTTSLQCNNIFQNENLIMFPRETDVKPLVTAPDILTVTDMFGKPLTNADIEVSQKVFFGGIKVDEKWGLNKQKMTETWQTYFKSLGYDVSIYPLPLYRTSNIEKEEHPLQQYLSE